jgi:predicted GIY-YIG superfamily endonuclease
MKKWYVYELVNLMGTVEYVGETINPKNRLKVHKCNSKHYGAGAFNKRADIFMNIVREFDSKKEAFDYQCDLQTHYGLLTDLDKKRNTGLSMFGENNGQSKLSNIEVEEIRKAYISRSKIYGIKPLSLKYNVSISTIHSVIHNKSYNKKTSI